MINIKDDMRQAKRVINYIALLITNCYQIAVGEDFLSIYKNICSWVGYIDAVQIPQVIIPYLLNNQQKSCRMLLESIIHKAF